MPPKLYRTLQTPVPFRAPNYPAPLQELFEALHIEPPWFTTPEKEDSIASTPPTTQINHMVLCTTANNTFFPDSPNDHISPHDGTHAPTRTTNQNVYIPKRKSMNVQVYLHTCEKREEAHALLDSGATENFMQLTYAQRLKFPICKLMEPRMLYNVNGTINKAGIIRWSTDVKVQTGMQHTWMRFFLSDIGNHKIILGYPWFSAVQPNIDWRKAWIDISHLPIILQAKDTAKARFLPWKAPTVPSNPVRINQLFLAQLVFESKPAPPTDASKIPAPYRQFTKVFSEEASHEFPPMHVWDHAIELKPGALSTLPGKIYPLSQVKLQELQKFVDKHLKQGTI